MVGVPPRWFSVSTSELQGVRATSHLDMPGRRGIHSLELNARDAEITGANVCPDLPRPHFMPPSDDSGSTCCAAPESFGRARPICNKDGLLLETSIAPAQDLVDYAIRLPDAYPPMACCVHRS